MGLESSMKNQHIINIADVYTIKLHRMGYVPKRLADLDAHASEGDLLCHCAWMCTEITSGKLSDEVGKLIRWLCFVQGVFSAFNVYTIDELRLHNAPEKLKGEVEVRIKRLEARQGAIQAEINEWHSVAAAQDSRG
jgi:hypothetical protein